MKELVEYIAKSLVDHPEEVRVTQVEGEHSVIIELRVAREEVGKVIGKQGRIANAMRNLLKVAAAKEEKRVILEII